MKELSVKDLEILTVDELAAVAEVAAQLQDRAVEDAMAKILETAVLIEGKKGRGKTLMAVAISYQLRERFGRHVIAVGSKMGLRPEFGPFQQMDEKEFKDALNTIAEVADETLIDEKAEAAEVHKALLARGVDLLYSTLVFDEAYKLFDASHRDRLSRLFGYFVAQSRHYHCTILLLTPHRDMVDKRVTRQVDWFGRCYHNRWTDDCTARLTAGLETLTLTVNGADDSVHVPYYRMYDSWVLLGFRKSHLAINKY